MRKHLCPEPTRAQLLRAFPDTPPAFDAAVERALHRVTRQKEVPIMKRKMMLVLSLTLLLVLLTGIVVYAAVRVRTVERYSEYYNDEEITQRLEAGDIAEVDASYTLDPIGCTVTDVIYADGILYGTAVIAPLPEASVVLLPEDYAVDDPAGYAVYDGEEAPSDAPSYAQLAQENGAQIQSIRLLPDGYVIDGELHGGTIGYFFTPQKDGSIVVTFEIYGDNDAAIARADSYTLQLYLSCTPLDAQGEPLPDAQQAATWTLAVSPTVQP